MTISQQPPNSVYVLAQQQCTYNNHNTQNNGGQNSSCGVPQQPTMSFGNPGGGQQQAICPPAPYKRCKNQNYRHTHGSGVDDTHTSAMCGKPGLMLNPNASRTNIMGRLVAGMHKTILPSACGHTPPNPCSQQQQLPQQHPPIAYYPPGGMIWQQPTPPVQFVGTLLSRGTYRQQTTMAMPIYQPGQGMMINVGQYPPSTGNLPMMQMGQQPTAVPMMRTIMHPAKNPTSCLGTFDEQEQVAINLSLQLIQIVAQPHPQLCPCSLHPPKNNQ
jgi:hypothetical protein